MIEHSFLSEIPEGTLPRDKLRLAIQGPEFMDRQWADDKTCEALVKKFSIILAIVDTREPALGFSRCYYQGADDDVVIQLADSPLPNLDIIKLAATGNHFLSVKNHPALSAGTIRAAGDESMENSADGTVRVLTLRL